MFHESAGVGCKIASHGLSAFGEQFYVFQIACAARGGKSSELQPMFCDDGFNLIRALKDIIRRYVGQMPPPRTWSLVRPIRGKPADAEFYSIEPQIAKEFTCLL